MNLQKIIYWIGTLFLCGLMLFSASMYFTDTDTIKEVFEHLQYPSYIVIPLAVLKVLGVVMVLWRKSNWLTEWAYAGFFFDLVLAVLAHNHANESITIQLLAMIALLLSYFFGKVVRT